MGRPILNWGEEEWKPCKREESHITAAEMKFMRSTAGWTVMATKEIQHFGWIIGTTC